MTITREQVADLQPGDVVEIRDREWPDVTYRGPLHMEHDRLCLGPLFIRTGGEVSSTSTGRTLTVVSRAPRPLYVNHPRTDVKQHDVIRDGEGVIRHCDAAGWAGGPTWWAWEVEPGFRWTHTADPPQPLTLLVDGETGQVVQ